MSRISRVARRARGCEYLFFSLGPYDKIDPDERPPPLGRWDDPSSWREGYPQVERRSAVESGT